MEPEQDEDDDADGGRGWSRRRTTRTTATAAWCVFYLDVCVQDREDGLLVRDHHVHRQHLRRDDSGRPATGAQLDPPRT